MNIDIFSTAAILKKLAQSSHIDASTGQHFLDTMLTTNVLLNLHELPSHHAKFGGTRLDVCDKTTPTELPPTLGGDDWLGAVLIVAARKFHRSHIAVEATRTCSKFRLISVATQLPGSLGYLAESSSDDMRRMAAIYVLRLAFDEIPEVDLSSFASWKVIPTTCQSDTVSLGTNPDGLTEAGSVTSIFNGEFIPLARDLVTENSSRVGTTASFEMAPDDRPPMDQGDTAHAGSVQDRISGTGHGAVGALPLNPASCGQVSGHRPEMRLSPDDLRPKDSARPSEPSSPNTSANVPAGMAAVIPQQRAGSLSFASTILAVGSFVTLAVLLISQTLWAFPKVDVSLVRERLATLSAMLLSRGATSVTAVTTLASNPSGNETHLPTSLPAIGNTVLSVGAFRVQPEADNLRARLAMLGFNSQVEKYESAGKNTFYRVLLGPFGSQEEQKRIRTKLSEYGIPSTVRDIATRKEAVTGHHFQSIDDSQAQRLNEDRGSHAHMPEAQDLLKSSVKEVAVGERNDQSNVSTTSRSIDNQAVLEEKYWNRIKDSDLVTDHLAFQEQFPTGKFYPDSSRIVRWITTVEGCKVAVSRNAYSDGRVPSWRGDCNTGKANGRGTLTWPRTSADDLTSNRVAETGLMTSGVRTGLWRAEFLGPQAGEVGKPLWIEYQVANNWIVNPVRFEIKEKVLYEGDVNIEANKVFQPHGMGTAKFLDDGKAEWYSGNHVNGRPDGQGILTFKDGSIYDGTWSHGKRNGIGITTKRDGYRYEGEHVNNAPTGKATIRFPNGVTYRGDVLEGRPHGRGVMTHPDWQYEGSFVNGKREGFGTFTRRDGYRYEGDHSNDQSTGPASITYPNGMVQDVSVGEIVSVR